MLKILNLDKRFLATLLLAITAMLMLAGCASSEEEAEEDAQSEVCDEMGAGNSGCL
jgi:uncharacterized protein YcfL